MTATNHVLTGTLIGLTVHQPWVATALALISHFALDALPHYGDENHTKKRFITVLGYDMAVASLVLLVLAVMRPLYWQLALACAIVAASPDLMWLPMWLRELKHLPKKPSGLVKRFHKKIQWAERAYNYPVEILWAAMCIVVLLVKLV